MFNDLLDNKETVDMQLAQSKVQIFSDGAAISGDDLET